MTKKTAIIIGATGLTGGLLLQRLIEDENYSSIKLFSRRSVNSKSPKVKEYLGDIIQLDNFKSEFAGDEVYCCIGTTKAKTKDEKVYKSIDYGIPTKAADLSKANGIPFFTVVSSLGANAKSSTFYIRTKGEMEEFVFSQNIENTFILRPSLIVGNRNESRLGEGFATVLMKLFNPFLLGKLKKYKSIEASEIVKCMHNLSSDKLGSRIIESDEIKNIANS